MKRESTSRVRWSGTVRQTSMPARLSNSCSAHDRRKRSRAGNLAASILLLFLLAVGSTGSSGNLAHNSDDAADACLTVNTTCNAVGTILRLTRVVAAGGHQRPFSAMLGSRQQGSPTTAMDGNGPAEGFRSKICFVAQTEDGDGSRRSKGLVQRPW